MDRQLGTKCTSLTVLKTGSPKCVLPPFPGDTPPTMFVPYAIACSLWKVPCVCVHVQVVELARQLIYASNIGPQNQWWKKWSTSQQYEGTHDLNVAQLDAL